MKYDTYIFDLDGTLLNSIGDLTTSCNHAMQQYHLPTYTVEEVQMMVGNGVRKLLERAIPGGLSHPLFEEIEACFREYYLEHNLDTTQPYEGVLEMLHSLKTQQKKIAVVSNKFDTATKNLVSHFFSTDIQVAIGENKNIRKKPAPDTVYEAIRQLGAEKDSCVYIGDSDVDIETASNCGIPCISVLWGFRSKEFLLEHGATTLIEKPHQLMEI